MSSASPRLSARAAARLRRLWARPLLALPLAAALVVPAGSAHGQDIEALQKLTIEQLGSIQITSVEKRAQSLSDAPAAVYVITHEQIVQSGYTSIPDILRLAPNLEVAQINANSYAISARGFNVTDNASFSNKLLVLIDGRSVYTPMFGGVYWDTLGVLPQDIERIEVISGPGATLWGANAVNGVINIITYPSSETQGGVLTLGLGTQERDASLQYGGRLGPNLTYRVHAEYSAFSAYPKANGASTDDSWSKPQGGFRLDWTPGNDEVGLQGDLFTSTQLPNGFIRGNDLMVNWRHRFDNGSSLQLLSYYDDSERYVDESFGFWVKTYDLELQHDFHIGSWNDFVWGVGERAIRYHVKNIANLRILPADATLNLANIFAQDTITLAPRLKLTLGLKLEDEPYAGLQPMPSARLAWKPTDSVLLWGAVSRAVRSPTPVDTGIREYAGAIDVLNGSSNFRPEALIAYELGTRVQASDRVSFSVSTYYNVYNDLRSVDRSPGGLPFYFANQMSAAAFGLEAWGNYQVTQWWRLSAGFSLQHEDFKFLPGSTQVLGLPFVANDPPSQAQLRSDINFGHGVTWDAFLRYVGQLPHPVVPAYVELNMNLAWQVNDRLRLSLSGFNLLHARHVEFITDNGSIAIPRSVLAQMQVRF